MKRFFAIAAISAIASSVAFADSVPVTAEFNYSPSQVQSQTGAAAEFDSIVDQARQACEVSTLGSLIKRHDEACVADLVRKAVAEINSSNLDRVFADSRFIDTETAPQPRQVAQR